MATEKPFYGDKTYKMVEWKRDPAARDQNAKTPEDLYVQLNEEFKFEFDPCPSDPQENGLSVDWKASNFVNPPYNKIKKWVKKCAEQQRKGKLSVCLLPSRTNTSK